MAVNREARDRLGWALAAYMRGEIGNLELHRIGESLPSDDQTVNGLLFQIFFLYDDFKDHPLQVTEEGWRGLQRMLVFLKTDLELQRDDGPWQWIHRGQLPSMALLGALAMTVWLTWGDPWRAAACWFVICGTWLGLLWLRDRLKPREDPDELEEYLPFESEEGWRRHQHLLEQLQLPEYEPTAPFASVIRSWSGP